MQVTLFLNTGSGLVQGALPSYRLQLHSWRSLCHSSQLPDEELNGPGKEHQLLHVIALTRAADDGRHKVPAL